MRLKIAEIREALYQELSKRVHLEQEVKRLISELKFDDAKVVLASIDDSSIREIDKKLEELEKEYLENSRTGIPKEPMELTLETTAENSFLRLDGKRLHHIAGYRIENQQFTHYAELSIKMLVRYPSVKEVRVSAQTSRCSGGAPEPSISIPCPPRKSKNETGGM